MSADPLPYSDITSLLKTLICQVATTLA